MVLLNGCLGCSARRKGSGISRLRECSLYLTCAELKSVWYSYDMGIQTFDTANVCRSFHCAGKLIDNAFRSTRKGYPKWFLARQSNNTTSLAKYLWSWRRSIPVIYKRELYCDDYLTAKVHGLVTRTVTEKHVGQNPEDFGYVNQEGLSRKHIFDSVKHSLRRLQLDYIDVLQCKHILTFFWPSSRLVALRRVQVIDLTRTRPLRRPWVVLCTLQCSRLDEH